MKRGDEQYSVDKAADHHNDWRMDPGRFPSIYRRPRAEAARNNPKHMKCGDDRGENQGQSHRQSNDGHGEVEDTEWRYHHIV